jgi:hypothetical protein
VYLEQSRQEVLLQGSFRALPPSAAAKCDKLFSLGGSVHQCLLFLVISFVVWNTPTMSSSQEANGASPQIATNHERSQNSQIDSLTREKNDLGRKLDLWNALYIGALAIALVVGGFGALAQLKTIQLSKRAVSVQEQIAAAKDRESERELTSVRNEATQRAAELELRAKGAEARIAEANRAAAEANRLAEQERLARTKIEERLAPRRVGREQHDRSIGLLKPYAGSVVAVTKLGDMEAGVLADEIMAVLREAGWRLEISYSGIMSPPPYGVQCQVDDSTPAGKALKEFLRTLPTASIRTTRITNRVAVIVVGLKPPP